MTSTLTLYDVTLTLCDVTTGADMTKLAETLSYNREVIRIWFCNKRQALKNTVRRLSVTKDPLS